MALMTLDEFDKLGAPTEDTLPKKRLATLDEFDKLQEVSIQPTQQEIFDPSQKSALERAALGIERNLNGTWRKLPSQALLMLGDAMVQETPQYKAEQQRIKEGKPEGLYNAPKSDMFDKMNYNLGQRIRNLAIKNLNQIDEEGKNIPAPADGSVFKVGEGGKDLAGDLAGNTVSLGAALLAGIATDGATVPAMLFGGLQAGSKYEDMRLTGTPADETPTGRKPDSMEKTQQFAAAYGIAEGGLEFIGIDKMMKLGDTFIPAIIKGVATEFVQEGSQTAAERVLDTMSGQITVKNMDDAWKVIGDIAYTGALGAITGGAMSVPMTMHTRNVLANNLETMGVSKKDKYKAADMMMSRANTDLVTFLEKHSDHKAGFNAVKNEVQPMIAEALKVTNLSESERVAKAAEFARMWAGHATTEGSKQGLTPEEWHAKQNLKIVANENGDISATATENTLNQPLNKDVNLDSKVKVINLSSLDTHGNISSMTEFLNDLTKNGDINISREDAGMVLKIVNDKQQNRKIVHSTKVSKADIPVRNASLRKVVSLLENAALVETMPNRKADKKPDVSLVHRFYIPVELNGQIRTLRLIMQEHGGAGVTVKTGEATLHDVIAEKVKRPLPPQPHSEIANQSLVAVKESVPTDLSIRDMLSGVKDSQGSNYVGNESLNQSARAKVDFTPDGAVLSVLKNADASSIPHEFAHIWLKDMLDHVNSGNASEKYKKNWKEMQTFLGLQDGQTMFTREQQEKFAKAFEAYLFEGKAPSDGLRPAFNDYRKWLRSVYDNIDQIGEQVTPEARRFLDAMFMMDEEYVRNRNMEAIAPNFVAQDFGKQFASGFIPLSTRLGKVHETLRDAIRKFEFNVLKTTMDDLLIAKPFLVKFDKLSKQDWHDLDLALKNRDIATIDEIVDRNGMRAEYDAVVQLYKDIEHRANVVGMDIGHIDNYFARKVVNPEALMAYLRGTKDWSKIQESITNENARRVAAGDVVMTTEEEANFVSSMVRGYGSDSIKISKTSHSKSRKLDRLDAVMNQYYKPSTTALHEYIGSMNNAIAAREFFGIKNSNVGEHIGEYVKKLVDSGLIDYKQEQEVQDILKARFSAKGATAFFAAYKNIAYIATMGSPISAITQIQDLGYSLYANGFFNTISGLKESFTGTGIKKQDLGIDVIAEEFTDKSKLSQAVAHVFNITGLTKMDAIGKEALINGALTRMSKQAQKNDPKLKATLDRVFGADAARVQQELANKQATDDVKYLLFAELSKFQPVSLSEMPEGYVTGGNARLLYMLKSYTIKQLDAFHNEAFLKMKNPATRVEGFQNLMRLAFFLAMMGAGTDVLKNWLLGRPTTLNDLVIDNTLRLLGVSKWTVYQFKNTPSQALIKTIVPPFMYDDVWQDLRQYVQDRIDDKEEPLEVKDFKTFNYVPLMGKFYYWWFGGGQAISEKKREDINGSN